LLLFMGAEAARAAGDSFQSEACEPQRALRDQIPILKKISGPSRTIGPLAAQAAIQSMS
jgi:hypothetical protein